MTRTPVIRTERGAKKVGELVEHRLVGGDGEVRQVDPLRPPEPVTDEGAHDHAGGRRRHARAVDAGGDPVAEYAADEAVPASDDFRPGEAGEVGEVRDLAGDEAVHAL